MRRITLILILCCHLTLVSDIHLSRKAVLHIKPDPAKPSFSGRRRARQKKGQAILGNLRVKDLHFKLF